MNTQLTNRETEILRVVAQTGCYKEASRTLSISTYTVKQTLRNINNKLGTDTTRQSVFIAAKKGII